MKTKQTFKDLETNGQQTTQDNTGTSKWTDKLVTDNITTRRKLSSVVLQIAVLTIFQQHCYMFNREIFKQIEGCPIGLKLMGLRARIIMDSWARKFMARLDRAGMELHLLVKYVDDINLVFQKIKLGTRSITDLQTLTNTPETTEQDRNNNRTET